MRGWEDSQEGEALGCVWYMETYNRQGVQMRTFSFLAALKLDSEKRAGWIMEGKRIILATPLYMALAE